MFVAFGDSARCTLAARRVDAVIAADGTLRVETRRYEAKDLTAVVCDDATAARLLPQLPCAELDVLTATVRRFEIALADSDRGVYEALDLRVAQHPSESDRYLIARVVARALERAGGVEFSRGLDHGAGRARPLTAL